MIHRILAFLQLSTILVSSASGATVEMGLNAYRGSKRVSRMRVADAINAGLIRVVQTK